MAAALILIGIPVFAQKAGIKTNLLYDATSTITPVYSNFYYFPNSTHFYKISHTLTKPTIPTLFTHISKPTCVPPSTKIPFTIHNYSPILSSH